MLTIYFKEIRAFFSAVHGYIIAGLFLLVTSLFLWVIPGVWNIPESGYASIGGFFDLAPWVFLFLIPSVSMKLFADEYQAGTMELLFTHPVRIWQIVVAKYLSTISLLIIILIPTLVWVVSLSSMAQPSGNIDVGSIWGSYIALLLLGSTYAALGILGSSLSNKQVMAVLSSMVLCFVFYSGFGLLGAAPGINQFTGYMSSLGMESHYLSMSRGVIDLRDVVYFISVIAMALLATLFTISRRR